MAYDRVVDSAKLETAITATADAIRAKTGSADKILWDAETGMSGAVESIATGIEPTGTLNIAENGSYDVTEYASAEVAVPVGEKAKPTVQVEVAANKLLKGQIDITAGCGVSVGVTAEPYYAHALYNGVRLPIISSDIESQYQYFWIRLNDDGTYTLLASPYKWYLADGSLYTTKSKYGWYIAEANAGAWSLKKNNTDSGPFGLAGGLIWASYDIPNGSAYATEVYFAGSDPVLAD